MKKQYMFILCLISLITLPAFNCERCCNKSHSHSKEHKHEAANSTASAADATAASEQTPLDTEVTSEK